MRNLSAILFGVSLVACGGAQPPAQSTAASAFTSTAAPGPAESGDAPAPDAGGPTPEPHVGAASESSTSAAPAGPAASDQTMSERGAALLDRMAGKDFSGARRWFDPTMRDALSADKLRAVWTQMEGQLGAYQGRTFVNKATAQGHPVLVYKLSMARGHVLASVVFDADGQIAGLFFRPA